MLRSTVELSALYTESDVNKHDNVDKSPLVDDDLSSEEIKVLYLLNLRSVLRLHATLNK